MGVYFLPMWLCVGYAFFICTNVIAISATTNVHTQEKFTNNADKDFSDLVGNFLKLNARVQLLLDECEHVEKNVCMSVVQSNQQKACRYRQIYTALIDAYMQCAYHVEEYNKTLAQDTCVKYEHIAHDIQQLATFFERVVHKKNILWKGINTLALEVLPRNQSLLINTLRASLDELASCCTKLAGELELRSKQCAELSSYYSSACAQQFEAMHQALDTLRYEIDEHSRYIIDEYNKSKNALIDATETSIYTASHVLDANKNRLHDYALRMCDYLQDVSLDAQQKCASEYEAFLELRRQDIKQILSLQKEAQYSLAHSFSQAKEKIVNMIDARMGEASQVIDKQQHSSTRLFQEKLDEFKQYYDRAHHEFSSYINKLSEMVGQKCDDRAVQVASLSRSCKYKFFDELSSYVHSAAGQMAKLSEEYVVRADEMENLIARMAEYISLELCAQVDTTHYVIKSEVRDLLISFDQDAQQLTAMVTGIIDQMSVYAALQENQQPVFSESIIKAQSFCDNCTVLIENLRAIITTNEHVISAVHDEFIVVLGMIMRLYAGIQQQINNDSAQLLSVLETEFNNQKCAYLQSHALLCEKISDLTKAFIAELRVSMSHVISNAQSVMNFIPGIEADIRKMAVNAAFGLRGVEAVALAWAINSDIEATVILACLCFRLIAPV